MKLKRKYITAIIAASVLTLIIITAAVIFVPGKNTHKVKTGTFELSLEAKGEVQGRNEIIISLPDELKHNELRVNQFKIKEIVEEGTAVKTGEWVANLDAAQLSQQIQDNQQDLERFSAALSDARIDSSIQLTNFRKELSEYVFDLEYKEIELEQAKFESPAYQRKKKVEFDQTVRRMEKRQRDYQLREMQLKMVTRRYENRYNFHKRRDSLLHIAVDATEITAPKDGMVMYARLWGGRKLRTGENVSKWMPTIALLPDMSNPVSEAYIPEIDVTKIALGDSVEITIDALAKEKFTGVISYIANIGQELSGFDMNVFRIVIDLDSKGIAIKPAMTTMNKIILSKLDNVIKIPRQCLFWEDGNSFVYLNRKNKTWKKTVTAGLENDEEVVIESGLVPGAHILIAAPPEDEEIAYWTE